MSPRSPYLVTESAEPVPLFGPEFHRDPAAVYRRMRNLFGPVAPVLLEPGVPAYAIVDYELIVQVCRDPVTWSHDSRHWAAWKTGIVPDTSELLPMLRWRNNMLFADGSEHTRLRRAVVDSLDFVDRQAVQQRVRTVAHQLLDAVAPLGKADLIADYAGQLPLQVILELFGAAPRHQGQILEALVRIWDGRDAQRAETRLERLLGELLKVKRTTPGQDLTTRLIQHYEGLSNDEIIHHLILLIGAGVAPTSDLIGNALLTLLNPPEPQGDDIPGHRLRRDNVVDYTLWHNTPMRFYPVVYNTREARVGHGLPIPQGSAVVLGLAAANLSVAEDTAIPAGNRAHLSFGVGGHSCPVPAKDLAQLMARTALAAVYERLPNLALAAEPDALPWRASPFTRALQTLPVTFTPQGEQGPWPRTSPASRFPSTPARTPTVTPPGSAWLGRLSRWFSRGR